MSDDTTAQALTEAIADRFKDKAPKAWLDAERRWFASLATRAVLDSGLVVSQDMYEIASAFGATAARERDYERARVDRLTRALAERDATIAALRTIIAGYPAALAALREEAGDG